MVKATIENIPEIYFTKLEVKALLLDGDDMYEAAVKQKSSSLGHSLEMLNQLADYYAGKGDTDKSFLCTLGRKYTFTRISDNDMFITK